MSAKLKYRTLLIIILTTYFSVPIIIMFNNYLYKNKFYILTIIGALIYLLMKLFKVSDKELGFSKKNMLISIKRNVPLILIMIIIIVVLKALHFDKYVPNESISFYIFYIFISCPIQEFLYRGVFGYFNNKSKNDILWIILSSLCYSYIHIIYKDIVTCILTFIIGIVWYILYKKDYNLIGIISSHIVLGILTISLGIVN